MSDSVSAEHRIAILQRFVSSYANDLQSLRAALADGSMPAPAQRLLIGGLNYALDILDMFPDHYKGLGVADDAIILRLAAKGAVAAGATQAAVVALAEQCKEISTVLDNLAVRLETFVARLPERVVRGRTADQILGHKDTRIMFDADVGREAKKQQGMAQKIDTSVEGPARAIIELRKMAEHTLKQAGIV
jgi:uncharacterized membrane protein YkvA (DUF1232 family)